MSEGPPGTPPYSDIPSGPTGAPRAFIDRLLGALKLDASVYDEVEHDPDALPQAAGVVAIAAVCAGIGGGGSLLGGVIGAVAGWLMGAGLIWLVGVRLLEHQSDYPELLRTIGFASAPQVLLALAAIPLFGTLVTVMVFFWGLAAYVVAVREALDVDTSRAVLVCLLAWGLVVVLSIVLAGC
ncbi:MAG: YIP1 family protein [Myxococcota bacterium]|nr:YIP1 family protein [Myxococcota bacterium]